MKKYYFVSKACNKPGVINVRSCKYRIIARLKGAVYSFNPFELAQQNYNPRLKAAQRHIKMKVMKHL